MKYLENPPALKINAVLYKGRSMPAHVRLEQRIVWNLLKHLLAKGWSAQSVDDGDEQTIVHSSKAAMELLFNLDDAYLVLQNAERSKRWVRFVFGNGVDVISDWNAVGDFDKAMNEFNAEEYA